MRWWAFLIAAMVSACGWPETKMVPVADYATASRQSVSAAPAYTAGPTTVRTISPDGSTRLVCESGGSIPASNAPPDTAPAC